MPYIVKEIRKKRKEEEKKKNLDGLRHILFKILFFFSRLANIGRSLINLEHFFKWFIVLSIRKGEKYFTAIFLNKTINSLSLHFNASYTRFPLCQALKKMIKKTNLDM